MNINFKIETWMSSLRKMCLVSVTQNILEIARHDPSIMDNPKSIASKAAEMVPKLDLPQTLNTEIVAIIRPVMEEMLRWYKRYGDVARVILTSHGTVNLTRSAKAVIASDQPVYQRFVAACEHCLEDDIFTLGKQVTSVMLQEPSNPHANFWYGDGGNFDAKIIGRSLSQKQVVKGWFLGEPNHIVSTMRYFQEKATMKSLEFILSRTWDYVHFHPLVSFLTTVDQRYSYITPALCNTSLRANVMDGEWLEKRRDTISTCLLLLLSKWPYQHLFLESAELLMPNLSEWEFWNIAETISKKLTVKYKEYDYKGLFIRFWNLGLTRFKSKLLVDNQKSTIDFLLLNFLVVKDEFLISLVFDHILQTEEHAFDFNSTLTFGCKGLFHDEAYESIEFLMRVIRTKYRELFLNFQNEFHWELIDAIPVHCRTWKIKGHDPFLDKYTQFMAKYWVLHELE